MKDNQQKQRDKAEAVLSGRPATTDPPAGGAARLPAVEFLKNAMNEVAAEGAAQHSVEERLAKLKSLRDAGVFSPVEYEAERQRILDYL